MGRHPVAVIILRITYARTTKVDYSRFSYGRATWEACSGNLEKKITRTIAVFALGPRKTKKNLSCYRPEVLTWVLNKRETATYTSSQPHALQSFMHKSVVYSAYFLLQPLPHSPTNSHSEATSKPIWFGDFYTI
jgi:hypothetical protein